MPWSSNDPKVAALIEAGGWNQDVARMNDVFAKLEAGRQPFSDVLGESAVAGSEVAMQIEPSDATAPSDN